MRRWRTLWIGCGCLIGVWSLAAASIWTARAATPSAAHVIALLQADSLVGRSPEERTAFLDALAAELVRLEADERRKVQLSDEIRALYPHMTSAERLRYLDRTRPPGIAQMSRAFDRMSPDRRRRHLNLALDDLDALRPDNRARMLRDGTRLRLEKIVRQGLAPGVGDEPTVEALELQPFVEQTQNVLQMAR